MGIKDRNRNWENLIDGDWVELCDNLWELLTGLILDIRTPLERLYQTLKSLKEKNLLDFRELRGLGTEEYIAEALKDAGYIWYNQKAKCFNQRIKFDLETATIDDMKSLYGIGDKLACMWIMIVHKKEYPIIDTHVKKYLRSKGYTSKKYEELSEAFKLEAKKEGLTVSELDKIILTEGIKNRLKKNGKD